MRGVISALITVWLLAACNSAAEQQPSSEAPPP
jgi:hypothetical protein